MSIKDVKPVKLSSFYPEEYLVEEDEMGESRPKSRLIAYLVELLEWLYRYEGWLVAPNLNHYHPAIRNSQRLIVPDVAVFKDVPIPKAEQERLVSWKIEPPQQPAPKVVFEISSDHTWPNDVGSTEKSKPAVYGRIGVAEYFAYDPNEPLVWRKAGGVRLRGWRYENQRPVELTPDENGWLWSAELDSWLAPDGLLLRLYDRDGNLRLTRAEAEAAARRESESLRKAEIRARQAAEQRVADLERLVEQLRNPQQP